jgi:pyruvate/2-oxoglutarate/acetoin dehydrogenase E1 component
MDQLLKIIFLGTANGFSRLDKKIRVVVEGAEFADYFWPAMEQLIECSHDYWRSNGKFVHQMTLSELLLVDILEGDFTTHKILKLL